MTIILITGPSRSGKSEFAEQLASQSERPVVYLATAYLDPNDLEWQERIDRHRRRRPPTWDTHEVLDHLGLAIQACAPSSCCLVDSLGTWVANGLERSGREWEQETVELLQSLQSLKKTALVLLVAEEVGWGLVPAFASGRQFRDRLGEICQQIGTLADELYLVVAGYVVNLKSIGQPITRYSGG